MHQMHITDSQLCDEKENHFLLQPGCFDSSNLRLTRDNLLIFTSFIESASKRGYETFDG